jgi:hypothetical protein
MTAVDEYLRKSSDRLLRQPWGDNAQQLSQELYAILRSTPTPSPGALQVNLGAVQLTSDEAPDLAIPLIDFDALSPAGVLPPQETTLKGSENQQTDNARVFRRRTVLVGFVTARSAVGTYTVRIYPNGPSGEFEVVGGVREVAGRDVADNTWVLVARIDTCRFVQTSITDGKLIQQSRIDLLDRQHFFAEGNVPRPYSPWGTGPQLNGPPARPRVLSHACQTVQDGIDGVQHASSLFLAVTPLLWLPDDTTRTFSNLLSAFVGGTGPSFGTVQLAFDKIAGTIGMAYSGGTPSGYSVSQNALTWAQSAGIGTATPGGVGVMSWPTNAWNVGTIYLQTGGGWFILTGAVTSRWQSLGGSPAIYTRTFLAFG